MARYDKRAASFHIGWESVGDYLRDLERRWGWGVCLQLRPELMADSEITATLHWYVTWNLKQSEMELVYVQVHAPANLEQDPYGIAGDVWDLLYQFDCEVQRLMAAGAS